MTRLVVPAPGRLLGHVQRLVLLALLAITSLAGAQSEVYPSRPLRLVVLFPAGNGIDTTTRQFADGLAKELGQPVIVDNKPGANGIIAVQAVKSAPPDGYTVLVSSSSPTTIATAFGKKLPYDPFKDFKPIIGFVRAIGLFTVAGDSKIFSLSELFDAAKTASRPTLVGTYADAYFLTSQKLANMAGSKLENVPYKGQVAMLQDLIGGQLDLAYGDTQTPLELVKAGKLRALAVTGGTRAVRYPDVPTVAESGYPGFDYYSWNAFFVRTETPPGVAEKLAAAMAGVLRSSEFDTYVRANGSEPLLDDGATIGKMMAEEVRMYKGLIEHNHIPTQQ